MKTKQKHIFADDRTLWPVLLLGFSTMTSQVRIMRELSALFYGNELTIGLILGLWLVWTAAGSGLIPRWIGRRQPDRKFAWGQLLYGLLFPATFLIIRLLPEWMNWPRGELLGLGPMFLMTLIVLAPPCLLSGLLYVLACRIANADKSKSGLRIETVYFREAAGSALGALLIGRFIGYRLTSAHIFLGLCVLNCLSAGLFIMRGKRSSLLKTALGVTGFLTLASLLVTAPRIQKTLDSWCWRPQELLASVNTKYGNITAVRFHEQISLYQNGLFTFSSPDLKTAELSVHPPLLFHPAPRNILMVGGGLNGSLREALKHPDIRIIDYVELDPELVSLAARYIEENRILKNARIRFHPMDGRRFIQTADQHYDVILINLPGPHTAQLNRFYTVEFFRKTKRILNPGGILSFSITASENVYSPELADFIKVILNTVSEVFSNVTILPGESARFIASDEKSVDFEETKGLPGRLKEKGIQAAYFREYYILDDLSKERFDFVKRQLSGSKINRINRDLHPVGYFYDTIRWSVYHSAFFKELYLLGDSIPFSLILSIAAGLFIISGFFKRARAGSLPLYASIATIGFSEIGLEWLMILGFQILYGHVFQDVSLIIAGYMIGLALGSYAAIKADNRLNDNALSRLKKLQFAMLLLPLMMYGVLLLLLRWKGLAAHIPVPGMFFAAMTGLAGYVGGSQFNTITSILMRKHLNIQTAGKLYAFDLLGSGTGALWAAAFLVPVYGISGVFWLITLINSGCWLLIRLMKPR